MDENQKCYLDGDQRQARTSFFTQNCLENASTRISHQMLIAQLQFNVICCRNASRVKSKFYGDSLSAKED